jgi:hypothetical protein
MSRWGVVEVAAALGLPDPTLGAVAVAAAADPLDLGRGPLETSADLVGLDLGDRSLVALVVSLLRWRSRPVTITRSSLESESAWSSSAGRPDRHGSIGCLHDQAGVDLHA